MTSKNDRPARSKMTVMMFQLEGSDETLQEGLKTISNAISGMLKPIRVINAPVQTGQLPSSEPHDDQLANQDSENENESNIDDRNDESTETRRNRKLKAPKILPDFKVPVDDLKRYCEIKKVGESDAKRYLVITGFAREKLNLENITTDHIYTCYKLLNWNIPADAGHPLRNLKHKGKLEKGPNSGEYSLNHVGENELREMEKA